VGYARKIFRNINWRIQLNVHHAFEHSRLIPVTVQPDGSPRESRIADGGIWEVTNRFRFCTAQSPDFSDTPRAGFPPGSFFVRSAAALLVRSELRAALLSPPETLGRRPE
jgi:hypothetical protein